MKNGKGAKPSAQPPCAVCLSLAAAGLRKKTKGYPYEPDRLITHNGSVIHQDLAPLEFKAAEIEYAKAELRKAQARRSTKRAREYQVWVARATKEYKVFAKWDAEQAALGRPQAERTFGNCVRETGVWIGPPSVAA
jgi:hypothetical protein